MMSARKNAWIGSALIIVWLMQIWISGPTWLRIIGVVGLLATIYYTLLNITMIKDG